MTKRCAALLLLLLSSLAGAIQLPMKINFQGRLTEPATNNPRNGQFDMTFKLYRGPNIGAALVYTEVQYNVPVNNGVFAVQLGSSAFLSADLLYHTSAYLGIEVESDGEMVPRQQLVMAPYAYTSAQLASDGAVGINAGTSYSTFTAGGNLQLAAGIVASTASFVNVTSGSGTFTSIGAAQYSLQTSSGIQLQAGTLKLMGASAGIDASGTGVFATTVTLAGFAGDATNPRNGMISYNTTSNRFRCYEDGAWVNCVKRPLAISLGGYVVVTNVGANYDTVAVSSGLGVAYVDFSGVTQIDFQVSVNRIGTGTQTWQLYNVTDNAEIGTVTDAAAGTKILTTTISAGLPTGIKLVRVRAKSTVAGDDPVYYGSTILITY